MTLFSHGSRPARKKRWPIVLLTCVAVVALLIVGGVVGARQWYRVSLQPVSRSSEVIVVTVESGSSLNQIAQQLKDLGLIKSVRAFETYVTRQNIAGELKAGVFELSPSWSVEEIVSVLVSGKEASELFTIAPGLRLDQIKQRFIAAGFNADEVDTALQSETYTNHPALVDKPNAASLEGYIYPESFRITATTTAQEVITQSLDELAKILTPKLKNAFEANGLSVHEAITIASIVEKEVAGVEDRKKVAQVMLKRQREGMMLGADATYLYAAAVYGGEPFPDNESPYNTRKYTGLPPGPISNVDITSLEAVAYPASTDYLYYVTGDDGTNHFTRTEEEHVQATKKYCTIACAPGYIADE